MTQKRQSAKYRRLTAQFQVSRLSKVVNRRKRARGTGSVEVADGEFIEVELQGSAAEGIGVATRPN